MEIIVKNGVARYIVSGSVKLTEHGVISNGDVDPTTTPKNTTVIAVSTAPRYFVQGQWGWDGEKLYPLPAFLPGILARAKADKLAEINAAYEDVITQLTISYPDAERLSFDKQELEAIAWTANNEAATPFIDALATGRQMDKSELVSRIMAKAALFSPATGYLTGQRQRYEDMLDAAETLEAVAAIVPEYTMPEGM